MKKYLLKIGIPLNLKFCFTDFSLEEKHDKLQNYFGGNNKFHCYLFFE